MKHSRHLAYVYTLPNFLIRERLVLKVQEEWDRSGDTPIKVKRTMIKREAVRIYPDREMKTMVFLTQRSRPLIRLYLSVEEQEIEKKRWLAKVATSSWFNRPVEPGVI